MVALGLPAGQPIDLVANLSRLCIQSLNELKALLSNGHEIDDELLLLFKCAHLYLQKPEPLIRSSAQIRDLALLFLELGRQACVRVTDPFRFGMRQRGGLKALISRCREIPDGHLRFDPTILIPPQVDLSPNQLVFQETNMGHTPLPVAMIRSVGTSKGQDGAIQRLVRAECDECSRRFTGCGHIS
jgi:hypothetical protein